MIEEWEELNFLFTISIDSIAEDQKRNSFLFLYCMQRYPLSDLNSFFFQMFVFKQIVPHFLCEKWRKANEALLLLEFLEVKCWQLLKSYAEIFKLPLTEEYQKAQPLEFQFINMYTDRRNADLFCGV